MSCRISWFFLLVLFGFLLVVPHSFALGVAPSQFSFDFTETTSYLDSVLIVNTMDFPVEVLLSSDDSDGIVDFFGVETVLLLAGESTLIDFQMSVSGLEEVSSDSFSLIFSERPAQDSSVSSFVTLHSNVYLEGVVVSDVDSFDNSLISDKESSLDSSTLDEPIDLNFQDEQFLEESTLKTDSGQVDFDQKEEVFSLSGDNLEMIYLDNNSGKLFLGITLLIILILGIHMVYRFLHPRHDF